MNKLTCTSSKCQYSATVGDGCVDTNDCMQGGSAYTCTSGICTGAVAADGACDTTAAKSCKMGYLCVNAKCAAVLAVGATCTESNMCPGGTTCAGASGAMKCVLKGSLAIGTESNDMSACMNGGYDSATKKCAAAVRTTGAMQPTGGNCTQAKDCKSMLEGCGSCTGGGQGVCRMGKTTGKYAVDTAAYNTCWSTSGCSRWSDTSNSMSCLVKACGKSRAECAFGTMMWDFNGGTAPPAANLDMVFADRPQCTGGAATATVSVMALLGAVAAALRLA